MLREKRKVAHKTKSSIRQGDRFIERPLSCSDHDDEYLEYYFSLHYQLSGSFLELFLRNFFYGSGLSAAAERLERIRHHNVNKKMVFQSTSCDVLHFSDESWLGASELSMMAGLAQSSESSTHLRIS